VSDDQATPAHDQVLTHRMVVHYPAHPARVHDPHYKDFNRIHRTWKADPQKWQCAIGKHRNDFTECTLDKPLELHHAHVEFSLQNGVDLAWLEVDYPGISDPDQVGAWTETAANLVVLCVAHHRGPGGVHVADASTFEAEKYIRGLVSAAPSPGGTHGHTDPDPAGAGGA